MLFSFIDYSVTSLLDLPRNTLTLRSSAGGKRIGLKPSQKTPEAGAGSRIRSKYTG